LAEATALPGLLTGRVALITGGGRGIGAAIAKNLANLGAAVVICGRTRAALEHTANDIVRRGGECIAYQCDVTDLPSIEILADKIRRKYRRLDILVNNAAIAVFRTPLHSLKPFEWDDMMNTNLRAVFYTMRTFVPIMVQNGGGHIINISSLAGKNPVPNAACYAATKWALNGLSYSVAEELRGSNIRVSVVCPGSVDTELTENEGKDKSKMLTANDVAHAVAMIATQAPQSFVSEVLIRPTQKP
jgi:3-oxoacyl-[acyl-carrier protein] reductase